MARPLILLSNDDGYTALGIRRLRDALVTFADVIICAPATEQSATSHSISLNRPLRLHEAEPRVFCVDGTPADCVYVALHAEQRVVPRRPDLVVAGMNHGLNLGNDVFYSGTVAAAREGALRGVSALAFSAAATTETGAACRLAAEICKGAAPVLTDRTVLLNINFPPGSTWPVRATELGNRVYQDGVLFRSDPRGGEYLWIGTGGVQHSGTDASDTAAFDAGVVGVTPLSLQLWANQHDSIAREVISRANLDGSAVGPSGGPPGKRDLGRE
jgi:5'-nucleotidase